MSATNRGAVRNERDFYPTPLSAFTPLTTYLWDGDGMIWEPACGDGRLVNETRRCGLNCWGSDIEPQGDAQKIDFISLDPAFESSAYAIVTNPPFSLAFEFCQQARKLSEETFLLLPLNFLASRKRRKWLQENEPGSLFVLSDRPSFCMVCHCKKRTALVGDVGATVGCDHKWTLAPDSPRPKSCPTCGAASPKVTTSDACDYAWFYWGKRHSGIIHL